VSKENFVITNHYPSSVSFAINQAKEQGWNPGLSDGSCFQAADPSGFFVALLDDQPIGCCSAICYDEYFAFFGFYVVKEEFRGKGYGMAMTQERLKYVGDRNIGLDGVIENESMYAKIGFKSAHLTQRYAISVSKHPPLAQDSAVKPIEDIDAATLAAYDRQCFPAARTDFLRAWLTQSGHIGYGYVQQGSLVGYGVIRPCYEGYKIGPLFADSANIAQCLLTHLLSSVSNDSVIIDIPLPNSEALSLIKDYDTKPIFTVARMYTRQEPAINLAKSFGVTTFELG
jgi:GNAT superfamily N-acetyltransferase